MKKNNHKLNFYVQIGVIIIILFTVFLESIMYINAIRYKNKYDLEMQTGYTIINSQDVGFGSEAKSYIAYFTFTRKDGLEIMQKNDQIRAEFLELTLYNMNYFDAFYFLNVILMICLTFATVSRGFTHRRWIDTAISLLGSILFYFFISKFSIFWDIIILSLFLSGFILYYRYYLIEKNKTNEV